MYNGGMFNGRLNKKDPMKKYQKIWCDRLENATTADEIFRVVDEMVEDDTGCCDLLAMMLASAIKRSVVYDSIDSKNR